MQRRVTIFGLAIALFTTGCSDAGLQATCQNLNATMDRFIVKYALALAEGDLRDKSAIQQSTRLALSGSYIQMIDMNLNLMAQNKCPARTTSITPDSYQEDARECALDRMSGKVGVTKCDFKTWKRDSER